MRHVIATLLTVLATLCLAAGAASAAQPSTGWLMPVVNANPWSLTLENSPGNAAVTSPTGSGDASQASVALLHAGNWEKVTSGTLQDRTGDLETWLVETTDPGHQFEIKIEPFADGTTSLTARVIGSPDDIEAIRLSFQAPDGERYLGFGERSNSVDQRGNTVENWTAEGPYGPHEAGLVTSFVPAWGLRTGGDGNSRPDSTYFPMPWLLSTSGYGVLAEETRPVYFHLDNDGSNTWSVEVARRVDGLAAMPADPPAPTELKLRFFAGPTPAAVVRRLSARLGRQPAPSPWALGPWVQSKGGNQATVDRLRDNDVPTSVLQTYTHYLPCGPGSPATEQELTNLAHSNGMAITTYFNPMICTGYSPVYGQFRDEGALTLKPDGSSPYTYNYLGYNVGETDFSSDRGPELYGDLLRNALGDGYDGWMEDFGEYHPPDSTINDGTPGMVAHNRYPLDYHCAASDQVADADRPVLRYVRSGYTGSAACSPVVWGGDPSTMWGFDGLQSAITNGLTMGLSGVGFWGSDIGGFFSILSDDLTPELLSRWIGFGAFSGVMRDQADGYIVGSNRTRAQILAPEQIQTWRRYAKLRTQLYPYVQGSAAIYRDNGLPLMRAFALQFPNDRKALAIEDQYMFGPDLMVAPVTEPGATTRKLYLPKGRWFNLWNSFRSSEANGFRLDLARAVPAAGGREHTVPAPVEQTPAFVRAGAMLVALPAVVDTLAPYGEDDPDVIRLEDRQVRKLLAFPSGFSKTRFEEGGVVRSRELPRKGAWRIVIKDTAKRTWRIRAALRSLERPLRPRCVKVNGKRHQFGYRKNGRLLRINLDAKSKKTVVLVRKARCR